MRKDFFVLSYIEFYKIQGLVLKPETKKPETKTTLFFFRCLKIAYIYLILKFYIYENRIKY